MDTLQIPLPNSLLVYVDDEKSNTYLFADQFEDKFNIKVFNDPKEAEHFVLVNDSVLLVVTDQQMPLLNGLNLAENIKKNKPFLSFIMLTANPENDRDLMYKSLKNNLFYDFLQKPLEFEKKTALVDLFVNAINSAFNDFLKVDFDKASKAFCRNPINLEERALIKKIVAKYFPSKVELNFRLSDFELIPEGTGSINTKMRVVVEKQLGGDWCLYEVNNSKRTSCATSRKVENIFNLMAHDPTLKGIREFLKI